MSRKINPVDMTVRDQIERIKTDFCEGFCKHYAQYQGVIYSLQGIDLPYKSEIIEDLEKVLNSHCDDCPLSRL